MLLSGLLVTIETSLLAWVIALVTGSIVGVLRTLPSKPASWFGFAYVEFFRNMPLLVQLFLWFFVLPELLPQRAGLWLKQLPHAPFWTAADRRRPLHVGARRGAIAGRHRLACRAGRSRPRPRSG